MNAPSPATLEIIGYVASVLVALSLMMRSLLRLRLINLIGAILFTIYGLLIGAMPVAMVNGFIVLINLYYLRGMLGRTPYFELLEVSSDDAYLARFMAHYRADILRFVPGFIQPAPDQPGLRCFFILRDMVPAGLVLASPLQDDPQTLSIHLDYVIPGYRDLKIGAYLYAEEAGFFRGFQQALTRPGGQAHARYLRRMGFRLGEGTQDGWMVRVGSPPSGH
jgi:hypothetical protein